MKEIACQFGESARLQGVLTVPANGRRPTLALVLLSAGLMAKSGPYRLYTQVARTLAEEGFMTLRFDLGGIGNSQISRPNQPLPVRTDMDIRDALDYLGRNYDVQEFVLGGLCSGAEDAFRFAQHESKVTGVILVDPHAYESMFWRIRGMLTRYTFNRIVYRILRTGGWIDVVEDARSQSNVEGFEGKLINYQYMKRREATRILAALLDRRAYVHYIYTGGRIDIFHHPKQFRSMFPGIQCDGKIAVDHLPDIEHVQIFAEDRGKLVETITRRFLAVYQAQ